MLQRKYLVRVNSYEQTKLDKETLFIHTNTKKETTLVKVDSLVYNWLSEKKYPKQLNMTKSVAATEV